MAHRLLFASTGRHIPRNIHHHYGFNNIGGWFWWLGSPLGTFDVRGSVGDEFAGGKFWDTEAMDYASVTEMAFHFQGGFTQPPGPLEICGLYSLDPDNRFMHAARNQVTIILDEDAHFRAYTDWQIGQPGDGTLIGTSSYTVDLDPADPDDAGGSLFTEEESAYLSDWCIAVKLHATDGYVIIWRNGSIVWQLTGVNTLGDPDNAFARLWTVGQRGSRDDGVASEPPFPGAAPFYWRFQHLVIADQALAKCRVRTQFANRDGTFNDFPSVNPNGGLGYATRWESVRDDPDRDFAPSPDESFTMVAQDGTSFNGETELFGFEALPSLGSEYILGVGVSVYLSGTPNNHTLHGFRAQVSPTVRYGSVILEGDPRDLFEDGETGIDFDPGVPFPDPQGTDRDAGLGFFGWLPYQDWWPTQVGGGLWDQPTVDSIEAGVQTVLRACQLSQVVLLVVTGEPLCEGNPQGPNPYPFPPPTPAPVPGLYERKNLIWRLVPLPTAAAPSSAVQVRRNLALRNLSDLTLTPPDSFGIRKNLAWRYPVGVTDGTVYDPPGPWPGGFDPCEIADPTPTPPDVSIGAPPDRLFFAWAITATQIGPLWTATYQQMGASIVTSITQAAARGGAIFGTPGDKTKFFTGGNYDPDKMTAWITSLANIPGFVTFILDAQDAGSFAGVHTGDDWENPAIWPRSGLSLAELNRIAGLWKSLFTDGTRQIRVLFRARSGQIGGTSLPNFDGIISQMRMTGREWDACGRNPATYADIELNFCEARGWILHLSQNVYQGETVRGSMTAAQVLANGLAWCDVAASHPHGGAVYGMGIWKFESEASSGRGDATTADYLNAYAAWRNQVQTLGVPT